MYQAPPFSFTTVTLDSHRRAAPACQPGKIETETADDFTLRQTPVSTQPKIVGLVPLGGPPENIKAPENIKEFEIEAYHVFPLDSAPPSLAMCPRESTDLRMSKSIRPGAFEPLELLRSPSC